MVTTLEEWARKHLHGPARRLFRRFYYRRRRRVSEKVRHRCGDRVRRGPFAGMSYPFAHRDAAPKCLGSYECELHEEIETIIARGYATVLNVGCAEGYYVVGLARRMPEAKLLAYDWNPNELILCRKLAEANQIPRERISYGLEVTHDDLDRVCGRQTLVLADIEGAELGLLDPALAPRLAEADILVELHDAHVPGIETTLRERFSETHDMRAIESEPRDDPEAYPELAGLPRHDQLAALRERPVTMRWLVLRSRSAGS